MTAHRTAKRLGSESVKLIYRRTRDEMPAAHEEVEALLHEGIEIEFLTTPVRFHRRRREALTRWNASAWNLENPMRAAAGARSRLRVLNSPCPSIRLSQPLDRRPETSFTSGLGVSLAKNGTIEIDPSTGATNVEGVFAGGDVATGPAYVVDAIAAGKKAARSISRYLKGEHDDRGRREKETGEAVRG